jgi:hypothetical protein
MTPELVAPKTTLGRKIAAVVLPAVGLLGLLTLAGAARAGDQHGERRGPPPQAIDACKDKKAGDTCQVAFPDHKVDGKCAPRRNGDQLVCRPEHGRRQPPPAAYEACASKKADDACEVTFRDRKLTGKCGAMDDGKLACRPARPHGPPPPR